MSAVLILDFDGVICDSIEESFVVGLNAYSSFQGQKEAVSATMKDLYFKRFREFRHQARKASDYLNILHRILEGSDGTSANTNYNGDDTNNFESLFFSERRRMQKQSPKYWLRLNPLYPGVRRTWKKLIKQSQVYIVTHKDSSSVFKIMQAAGLDINPENIKGKEVTFEGKANPIKTICRQAGLKPEQVIFIDDLPRNLESVEETGVKRIWASWGYGKTRPLNLSTLSSFNEILEVA